MATAQPQAAEITGHAGRITALSVGEMDGRPLVWSGGEDGALLAWDLETLAPTMIAPAGAAVTAIAAVPGSVAVAREDGTISVGERRSEVGFAASSLAVAGRTLWAVNPRGVLVRFLLPDVKRVDSWDVEQPRVVATGDAGVAVGFESGEVVLFSPDAEIRWRGVANPRGAVTGVAVVGDEVITGGDDGFVGVWNGPDSFADVATGAPATALAARPFGGQRVVATGHADGMVQVVYGDQERTVAWETGTEPVATLALAADADRLALLTGDADGRVRTWDPEQLPLVEGSPSDKVEWLTDEPARTDTLRRAPLARALASRLRRIRATESGRSFLIHINGAWGTGKSTLLRFLADELRRDEEKWLVVDFNAWQRSRVGPPWWALLIALRNAVASTRGPAGRLVLRIREAVAQLRRTGGRYLIALGVATFVAAGLYLLLKPGDTKSLGDSARSVAAVLAGIGTLWAAGMVVARMMLWDSAKGAQVYEQAESDPMAQVSDHFAWLVRLAGRPILFFIDDLDRCPGDYVVDLLEAVQTLMRDDVRDGDATYFVVAADGCWIRTSYEHRYQDFAGSVGEPGRPLGYLFLDKLFQLTVRVPAVSALDQANYFAALLAVKRDAPDVRAEVAAAHERLKAGETDAEVIAALGDASPEARQVLRTEAVARLSEPAVAHATEHALERFAEHLEPNPRAMKRFVNEFGLARVVLTLEDELVPFDALARWTILSTRWPRLADRLREQPGDIELVGTDADGATDELDALLRSPHVVAVAEGLTPALVEQCMRA